MTNLSSLAGFSTGGGASGDNPIFFANDGAITASSNIDTEVSGYSGSTSYGSYTGTFPAATSTGNIKDRNIFGIWKMWTNGTSTTGFSITSFEVDKTTGAISVLHSGAQPVWTNTSGLGASTTNLHYDPNHGCFFSGTHSALPGHTSHVFGYTAGQLDSSGAIQNTSNSYTNGDHGYNGTYCACLPQGSTNYFLTAGYTNSYASRRIIEATSSGITVGASSNFGSWTSSSNAWVHIPQPDITSVPSGETLSAIGTSFASPDYGWAFLKQGNSTVQTTNISAGYQKGTIYPGYNGTKTLLEQQQDYGTLDASNNFTSLKDGTQDLDYQLTNDQLANNLHGVGNNKFLFAGPNSPSKGYDLFKLDSNNNPVHLQTFATGSSGAAPSILDNPSTGSTASFLVYENSSDDNPKWFVQVHNSSNMNVLVTTKEIDADFTQYN